VDISSALLVTDLAPWASLVQRFGRCNRACELESAEIHWIDRPLTARSQLPETGELNDDIARPYDTEELRKAESIIDSVVSAALADLPQVPFTFLPTHVLRRRDLLDLFDTTSDLSGYDLDVSRFIRSENDRDLLIAWRKEYPPRTKDDAPSREELCSAPIHEINTLVKPAKKGRIKFDAVTWHSLQGEWSAVTADELRPGMILVANAASGGYDMLRGWDPNSEKPVIEVTEEHGEEEGNDDEPRTFLKYTQTLAAHSREVRDKMQEIASALARVGIAAHTEDLITAAIYHDWGKAHPVFQKTVNPAGIAAEFLAKSRRDGKHGRKRFRHELASALALLQSNKADLAAYLAAAHHGKVRLSIRALPDESKPEEPGVRFARGIYDGDLLPAARLDGITTTALTLDLEPMLLGMSVSGMRSWIDRMLELRDTLGVFRLAYLEALIVASDCRASASPTDVIA
jgi:CRISPR-associated endonuclease/helicase Cas3